MDTAQQSRDIVADLRAFLAEHARHADKRIDSREPAMAAVDRINAKFHDDWRD